MLSTYARIHTPERCTTHTTGKKEKQTARDPCSMQDPLIAQKQVMSDTGVFFWEKRGFIEINREKKSRIRKAVFLEFSQWK